MPDDAKTAPQSEADRLTAEDHLFLVDGSGYIFRAFHALPPMTRPDGTPVNAVFGFTNMLMKLLDDTEADHIAVIFDKSAVSFRNDLYPDYKAQRPDPPEELIPQFGLIREAVRAFNLPCIEMEGFEADDIIATYARQAEAAGAEVTIVSSDKDLMQLVGGRIDMLDPMKNRPIGPPEVMEKFGVPPEKVIDVQALAGDSVDNVPGVPGIGVKTAAQLIEEYGDLEALLARAGEIKQPKRRERLQENADLARISKELVTLKDDVPVEEPVDAFAKREPDADVLLAFLRENNFRSLTAKWEAHFGVEAEGTGQQASNAALAVGEAAPAEPEGPAEFVLVQDLAELEAWVAEARDAGALAVDTETSSLDARSAELIGVSMAIEPGRACYVPLGHTGAQVQGALDLAGDGDASGVAERPKQIPLDQALAVLKPMLEDRSVLKIGHNFKYDLVVLANYGIHATPIDDTMLISYALNGGAHGHGMDELAELHFGYQTIKYKDVAGSGKTQIPFAAVPLDQACDYAAEDAEITLRLHRLLKPRLVAEHMTTLYETIERPLIEVVAVMEGHGIKVDPAFLNALSDDMAKRLVGIEADVHRLAGREFTIGSPKQLSEILFDEMSLEPEGRRGKNGAYSTSADVLEKLAAQGHDLPQRVLDWRSLSKLKSTYTDALGQKINPKTGRVHTHYALAATNTGRLSSTDPNLQNIPVRTEEGRKIREAFVAEPGNVLLSVDYSQIELRLVAEMAGVPALKQAFRDGVDIHALTASQVFDVPLDQMDSETRRKAKAINFGIIYGISGYGLASHLGCTPGEANQFIKAYFGRFPEIRDYMDETKAFCRKNGYVLTRFGRRCHIPTIADKNPARRGFAERQAINAPIQGTAADIIKRAMRRVPPALCKAGLTARMLLQVHDELLFEVPEAEVEETAALVRQVMEGAPMPVVALEVPLVADAGWGPNWAAAH